MMKPLILCALGAALWLGIVPPGHACKYCQMAMGADPDGYRAGSDTYSGAFPLEASIDKFQPATPPAPMTVVTSAADLPKPVNRPVAAAVKAVSPIRSATKAPPRALGGAEDRLLNGGLLGLTAIGGVFFWRTRRQSGTV